MGSFGASLAGGTVACSGGADETDDAGAAIADEARISEYKRNDLNIFSTCEEHDQVNCSTGGARLGLLAWYIYV